MSAVCDRCGWPHDQHTLAARRARVLVDLTTLGEPDDPWGLPDDDTIDPRAIEVARLGKRRVKLTRHERLIAATFILEDGHHAGTVCERLALPRSYDVEWHTVAPKARELLLVVH